MFRSSEQQHFSAIVRKHMDAPDGPLLLEGGTGLGKTRAYLAAIQNKRVAIVLPTHQLIDQMLVSSDLKAVNLNDVQAFRPARFFETRAEYERSRDAAKAAQVLVCTAASVIIDQRLDGEYNGVTTDREYIIFDEADQLPDMAALQSDFRITQQDLSELGIKLISPKQALNDILSKKPRTVEPELRAAARVMLEALEDPAWYHSCGQDDQGGIALTHKLPGRMLKKISNRPTTAFISATLSISGKFDNFKMAMGIERESMLSTCIEPLVHGTLNFHTYSVEIDTPEWIEATVDAINRSLKPTLVATSSHDLTQTLAKRIPGTIARQPDETAADAAARIGPNGVLITAGAWAGLDTPVRWRSIVVPRIPYAKLEMIDGDVTTTYLDARNTALRRLRQVIGRGLRTPDAICDVYIVDGRYSRLEAFVPERFRSAWSTREKSFQEGAKKEFVTSAAERDPRLRQAAIKKYGLVCMACGLIPRASSQIDVHHKNPVAEGERITTLKDVLVLCANCHRLAHTESPPLDLDALRA
jgi:Rad3-related DNA helicase